MKKKMIFLMVTLLMVSMIALGCSTGASNEGEGDQSLEKIKENGTLVMGLDDSFPPMGFRDENGEIVGFDIDLAKEVTKRMGVELELKPIDWEGKELSLKSGDIDIIWNGLSITDDRKKQILFSVPYLNSTQAIVVNAGSDVKSKADFEGKIVGVQMGSTAWDALQSEPEVEGSLKETKQYKDNVEALLDLKSGRTDAVIVDEIVGRYYTSQKPGEYEILEEDFGAQAYGIGFRLEDKALQEEVDKILDEMEKDGVTAEVSEKWFGKDIVVR